MIGQATATQNPPLRSARQRVVETGTGSVNTAPNVDAPRFFVQFGWQRLEVDTEAIPGKQLLRGEITPCRSHQQKSNIFEIPEGMRIPGMDQIDPASGDRKVIWGFYWKRAADEATRLIELESSVDQNHRMGLTEIKSLAGIRSVYYDQYDFNEIFYPNGLDNLPIKNAELKAHLEGRVDAIAGMNLPAELKPVLLDLGRELIDACESAIMIQSNRIEFAHRCMALDPKDSSGYYKKNYDALDEESLERTGKPRVGEALETQAKALHILAEDKALGRKDDPFAAMAKAQHEQNEILREQLEAQRKRDDQNQQLIQLLMAERTPKTEDAPLEVKLPPSNKK